MKTNIHITKKGSRLRRQDSLFLIESEERVSPVAPGQVAALFIYPGVNISSDAILMAIEHEADIVIMGIDGSVQGRIWSHRYGSISTLRRKQLAFCSGNQGFTWIKEWLLRKIKNQIVVLEVLHFNSPTRLVERIRRSMEGICDEIKALQTDAQNFKQELRILEAAAGKIYWRAVSMGLPAHYRFKARSRQPAQDAFNAMLNYAYGILYASCEKALIVAGIDPFLGVLHADMHRRPVLVFDFIEPYRQWADYTIIRLCTEEAIGPECMDTDEQGAVRLNPYGARIVAQCMHDYLGGLINLEGNSRSRKNHIDYDAQQLASRIAAMK